VRYAICITPFRAAESFSARLMGKILRKERIVKVKSSVTAGTALWGK
jgi:hypothetical protein